MKAATERILLRWVHLVLSIPIIGYIYGPVAEMPGPAFVVKWVFVPLVVLSGLWMWKGYLVRKWFREKNKGTT